MAGPWARVHRVGREDWRQAGTGTLPQGTGSPPWPMSGVKLPNPRPAPRAHLRDARDLVKQEHVVVLQQLEMDHPVVVQVHFGYRQVSFVPESGRRVGNDDRKSTITSWRLNRAGEFQSRASGLR